jgi:hypothetical protein
MGVAPVSVMKYVYTEFPCSVMLSRTSTLCAFEVLITSNSRSVPLEISISSDTWPSGVPR